MFTSPLKGELTVVVSKKKSKSESVINIDIIKQAKNYLKKYSLKDVVELVSKKEKISKNKIYEICLKIKKNEKET